MDLNRSERAQAWRCDDLLIDKDRRVVLRDGHACMVGARAFDLLVALIERHDRVVGKHELIDLVWPDSVVEENNLQVHISALRKLVGAHAIATVPGRGYRFTGPLRSAAASDSFAWRWQPRGAVVHRPCFCAFVSVSVDGFVAREDGAVDWLEQAQARVPDGEDCGYGDYLQGMDLLVMDPGTLEQVLAGPRWPYEDRPVHVLGPRSHRVPAGLPSTVTFTDEGPAALAERLQSAGHPRRADIEGRHALQWFLREGLLDEVVVTVVPVLLGRGLALSGPLARELPLAHVGTRTWPFGFVQSTYRRA